MPELCHCAFCDSCAHSWRQTCKQHIKAERGTQPYCAPPLQGDEINIAAALPQCIL